MAFSAAAGGRQGRRRRRGRERQTLSEINVTPLVDVMLVLLIIFMISAPLLSAGVKVDLPKTEAGAIDDQNKPITLTIRKDGSIFIDDDAVAYESLGPRLDDLAKGAHDKPIFVRADGAAPYEAVAKVMAKLQVSGFSKINLLTDTAAPTKSADKTARETSGAKP
ncbi:MAG TPA: biopolymer transporter ExbD [Caulobacteraceae bacterium]|jgi:biopolymer transport protein TolR|nr:biopolymer transporter ExbD [Caulobacteraceae bacterium]